MIYENETLLTIDGINSFTDLESAAEVEEPFVFAMNLKAFSIFLLLILIML